MVLVFQPSRPAGKQATSPPKASSVPGIKHTAVPRSSTSAKPRVPVPKSRVTSLSPTFAARDRTLWRLKSHISDSFPPAWCPGLSMPPTTPAVTSLSKKGADTRWIFDGESKLHFSCVLFRLFQTWVPRRQRSALLMPPPRSQRGGAANVRYGTFYHCGSHSSADLAAFYVFIDRRPRSPSRLRHVLCQIVHHRLPSWRQWREILQVAEV